MDAKAPPGFYRLWLNTAATGSWDRASTAAAIVSALLALAAAVWPTSAWIEEGARWAAPVAMLALVFAIRLLKAPLDIYKAQAAESAALRSRLDQRQRRQVEAERLQGVADRLTSLYEYGVHGILHTIPSVADDTGGLTDWAGRLDAFNQQAIQTVIDCGCTVQELNDVRTIAVFDLADGPGPDEMHALRLRRINAIALRYAEEARILRKRLMDD